MTSAGSSASTGPKSRRTSATWASTRCSTAARSRRASSRATAPSSSSTAASGWCRTCSTRRPSSASRATAPSATCATPPRAATTSRTPSPWLSTTPSDRWPSPTTATSSTARSCGASWRTRGSIFQSTSDTEVVVHLIAALAARALRSIASPRPSSASRAPTPWSSSPASELVAVRDPHGFRPLCLGTLRGAHVVASETLRLRPHRAPSTCGTWSRGR